MHAGRVERCPLVSHAEYAPRARLKLEKRWDRQTHKWTLDAARVIEMKAIEAPRIATALHK